MRRARSLSWPWALPPVRRRPFDVRPFEVVDRFDDTTTL